MLPAAPRHVPLAHVVRSGLVESVHHGSAVAVAAGGTVVRAWGEPEAPHYPRSSVKPVQATAMVGLGLRLPPPLLALVASSHSGEERHLAGVDEILGRHGLDASALDTTPDRSLDPLLRAASLAAGRPVTPREHNCSGKHAGMLATCVVNGWPAAGYLDPGHPVQRALREAVGRLTGARHPWGVDGCGAPAPVLALTDLARAFSALATAAEGSAARQVADAVRTHAGMLGGRGRDVTALLEAVPGLVAKDGAEAVWAMALPDGRAAAVKVADGGERAMPVVLAALLRDWGVGGEALDEFAHRPVLGHGREVGRVLPLL